MEKDEYVAGDLAGEVIDEGGTYRFRPVDSGTKSLWADDDYVVFKIFTIDDDSEEGEWKSCDFYDLVEKGRLTFKWYKDAQELEVDESDSTPYRIRVNYDEPGEYTCTISVDGEAWETLKYTVESEPFVDLKMGISEEVLDKGWYRIVPDKTAEYTINSTENEELDPDISLFSSAECIASDYEVGNFKITGYLKARQEYFIQISNDQATVTIDYSEDWKEVISDTAKEAVKAKEEAESKAAAAEKTAQEAQTAKATAETALTTAQQAQKTAEDKAAAAEKAAQQANTAKAAAEKAAQEAQTAKAAAEAAQKSADASASEKAAAAEAAQAAQKVAEEKAAVAEAAQKAAEQRAAAAETAANKTKVPAKIALKSLKPAKKALTVKWTKQAGVTGYEIQYATNKKFTKNVKTIKVKKAATSSKKITKLKAKTKYYVRIRGYKSIDGGTIYGKWSKVLNKKTK